MSYMQVSGVLDSLTNVLDKVKTGVDVYSNIQAGQAALKAPPPTINVAAPESKFPVLPVVLGGAALLAAFLILRKK